MDVRFFIVAGGLLALAGGVLAGLDVIGSDTGSGGTVSPPALDYRTEQQRIEGMFEDMEVPEAVESFQKRYGEYDEETLHTLEHFLGEELYRHEGANGLALCTESLLFGCYHGFFVEAFLGEGIGFVVRAEEACKRWEDFFKASGCIHGIGHGLLSLEGHTNLETALQGCDAISYLIPFGEEMCYTGVFMEYNTKTVHGLPAEIRVFDPSRPHDPCPEVPGKYQPACYLQLPQWWNDVMPNEFGKMGDLCAEVQEAENRERCFRSIGMVATRATERNQEAAYEQCSKMPGSEERFFCTAEAAKLLLVLREPNPFRMCSFLEDEENEACVEDAKRFLCERMRVCDEKELS